MYKKPDSTHLYRIAEKQAGYFTADQAHEAGFSWERLSSHASSGRFARIQQGIYRLVQFPGSSFEDLFIAWLQAGPHAVISHESALYLYQLSDVLPAKIHVIIPRTGSRRRKNLQLHTTRLDPKDITYREGLPVTTPARTIIDVAASGLAEELVRQAVRDALRRGLTDSGELLSTASRRGGKVYKMLKNLLDKEAALQ